MDHEDARLTGPLLLHPVPCSLLAYVGGPSTGRLYSTEVAGWCLTAGFFLDAWFLGEQRACQPLPAGGGEHHSGYLQGVSQRG
jgi:hypothetical protein